MKFNQLKIFVSSTFIDLADVRENVLKFLGVLKSDLISMEFFGSDEQASIDVCLKNVKNCNLFIGIYAERYGFIDPNSKLSLTELEYHVAYEMLNKGEIIGLLLYVLDSSNADWPVRFMDREQEAIQKLDSFKKLIKRRHTLTFFKDKNELPFYILRDTIRKLELATDDFYQPRNVQPVDLITKLGKPLGMGFFSSELSSLFFGRSTEIDALVNQIIKFKFSLLIGISGIGKTSILNAGVITRFQSIGWITCITRPLNDPLDNLRRNLWSQLFNSPIPSAFGFDDVIRTALSTHSGKKILVIIDQLDDILNNKNQQQIDQIVTALNQLYMLKNPDLHLLISYRGDVESEIGIIWQKISGAADGLPRFYLSAFNKQNARDVLKQTLANLDVLLEPLSLLDKIVEDIVYESINNGHIGIFPPFIQMVIATIYLHLKNNIFSERTYLELGTSKAIISNYLYSQLDYLGTNRETGIKILVSLVSNYGTKTQKNIEEIAFEIAITTTELHSILNKLLDLRLVRHLEKGYEITHDLLAKTILNGLMTDEEKEIRRFKYLLESKAQAFATTSSTLTFSEYLHIYKYRKRISCTDLEFILLSKSSEEHKLPVSYWIDETTINLLTEDERMKLEIYQTALEVINKGENIIIEKEDDNDEMSINLSIQAHLKRLALKSSQTGSSIFFEGAIKAIKSNNHYNIDDKVKYKSLLGMIYLAKFGHATDLKTLNQQVFTNNDDRRYQYIALRSFIYLSNKCQLKIKGNVLYNYGGKHWRSVFNDLNKANLEPIDIEILLKQIENNVANAPYTDYIVELLTRIISPHEYEYVLEFIVKRTKSTNHEILYDKYISLALTLGADFNYFLKLIEGSLNELHIKFAAQLHQRIAKLAASWYFPMLHRYIDKIITLSEDDEYNDLTESRVLNMGNRPFYIWVIGCAYCNLAGVAEIPTLITLLKHNIYTLRKAAFDRLVLIGREEDIQQFFNQPNLPQKSNEFLTALCLLDGKAYLMNRFDQLWNNAGFEAHRPYTAILHLLPKIPKPLVDPETAPKIIETDDEYDDLPF